jgi:hypothetical protein
MAVECMSAVQPTALSARQVTLLVAVEQAVSVV